MTGLSTEVLTIGVSSRALFDLEEENEVYLQEGVSGYRAFQLAHENKLLNPGTAFHLVRSLLELNRQAKQPIVEVVIMSRNSPETGLRVLNSIAKNELAISRMAFTGGESLAPYIEAFNIDLFLSKDAEDVQSIIDSKTCAAAYIFAPPLAFQSKNNQVKIAFDADAVLFSEESELRYKQEGLDRFHQFEKENEDIPLTAGPFANLLLKLSKIQNSLPETNHQKPLRIAIVTARSAPAHLRVIKTLRNWGVDVDEAYFMGGLPKDQVLKAFGAQIFFDDQDIHLNKAAQFVPSGKVPYASNSTLNKLKDKLV